MPKARKSVLADERLGLAMRGHNGGMGGSDAPKIEWVVNFPSGPPEKKALARLVDADGGRDDAENCYYEAFADPDFVRVEAAQRRFRGQYL